MISFQCLRQAMQTEVFLCHWDALFFDFAPFAPLFPFQKLLLIEKALESF